MPTKKKEQNKNPSRETFWSFLEYPVEAALVIFWGVILALFISLGLGVVFGTMLAVCQCPTP